MDCISEQFGQKAPARMHAVCFAVVESMFRVELRPRSETLVKYKVRAIG